MRRPAEGFAREEPLGESREMGMRLAPVLFRQSEVEVAECVAGRDVGEREAPAEAELVPAEVFLHDGEAAVDLELLAVVPFLWALPVLWLAQLMVDGHCRFGDAVAQRFPAPDLDAVGELLRYQSGPFTLRVEILDRKSVV